MSRALRCVQAMCGGRHVSATHDASAVRQIRGRRSLKRPVVVRRLWHEAGARRPLSVAARLGAGGVQAEAVVAVGARWSSGASDGDEAAGTRGGPGGRAGASMPGRLIWTPRHGMSPVALADHHCVASCHRSGSDVGFRARTHQQCRQWRSALRLPGAASAAEVGHAGKEGPAAWRWAVPNEAADKAQSAFRSINA